jgi:hypothetical protein
MPGTPAGLPILVNVSRTFAHGAAPPNTETSNMNGAELTSAILERVAHAIREP